jgi:Domain of unknown function (DUF4338)
MIPINELLNKLSDFTSFYDYTDITGYYLKKKKERLTQFSLHQIEDKLFNDPSVNPLEMSLEIQEIDGKLFNQIVTPIATFPIESQIGRKLVLGVKETNTDRWVGFIRLASPVSSIRPRNEYFGMSLPLNIVNQHFVNGQTIVPVQPFGFNYLGGKLLSMISTSNEVREMFNKKYNTDLLMFETTSLYGSSKSVSMYDGLEPYIKFRGLTESVNYLFPTDDVYFPLRDLCRQYYGIETEGGMLVRKKGSSPKSREFNRMISIVKDHLHGYDENVYSEFVSFMNQRTKTLQQKRFYTSTYGFTNVKEHLMDGQELVRPNPNKYDLDNIINHWKQKSYNRWTKLNHEGKIKTDLEIYSDDNLTNGVEFKIIR